MTIMSYNHLGTLPSTIPCLNLVIWSNGYLSIFMSNIYLEVFWDRFPLRSIAGSGCFGKGRVQHEKATIESGVIYLRIDLIICFLKSTEDKGVSHCWLSCKCHIVNVAFQLPSLWATLSGKQKTHYRFTVILSSIPSLLSSLLWASYN